MGSAKKIQLGKIKGLMLVCHALLLVFAAHWLVSQYNEQQEQLKKNLTKLFTDVQHKVSDSLLLSHINVADTTRTKPTLIADSRDADDAVAAVTGQGCRKPSLSPQGLYNVIYGSQLISKSKEKELFHIDTIVFNELFANEMRHNGWNFNSIWVNNVDSQSKGKAAIFIKSDFFTTDNGVIVSDYNGYLLWRMIPQFSFAVILVVLTGVAFWITFRSLKAQIKLSSMKDDFISNMTHELKTPIATVKVTLEALNNFNVIENPTLSREYLGMATAEMDRLELLATRVLNTSLMESGKIYLQREKHDLKELVTGVLETMQLRLSQQNARVHFEATGDSFVIPIDKLHTQGVLINLIDNSLKYGEAPVDINIRLTENNGAVQLALTDNGPGIPEEYTEKVFDKFFRVPTGNRHNTKGHGLGLNYAKHVMRLHNGNIFVKNVAEGGCMFTLSF
jgi:signal transduction histidine kinase